MSLTNYQKQSLKRILGKNADLSITKKEADKIIEQNLMTKKEKNHVNDDYTIWTKDVGIVINKHSNKSVKTFSGWIIQISNAEKHCFKKGDLVSFERGNPYQHRVLAKNLQQVSFIKVITLKFTSLFSK